MSELPEDTAFRREVREHLEKRVTHELREAARLTVGFHPPVWATRQWLGLLAEKGWSTPYWPVEDGGPGWSPSQFTIFEEECERIGAPRDATAGINLVGQCIVRYGTPEQKARYLPPMADGREIWAQGYSEPNAGSDLASLQLRAESDGDDYVLNGSKIWTSLAHQADCIFALVRTSGEGKKQQGISFLLMDAKTPGITVRPLPNIAGDHEFNQVFFSDVRAPKSQRLGEENQGWTIARVLLSFEHGGAGGGAAIRPQRSKQLKVLREVARQAPSSGAVSMLADADFAHRLAAAEIDELAVNLVETRLAAITEPGEAIGINGSISKLRHAPMVQLLAELEMRALGYDGVALQTEARQPGATTPPVGPDYALLGTARYLAKRAQTIAGGTPEVHTNNMARQLLRL
ncbi:MAG: acyl-CoA dehydrogenase family protein [Caulobacteraceae bacterium]|nr:acyl-CoA dehydrogenase family protein [Caulobacteraceae bacterium]